MAFLVNTMQQPTNVAKCKHIKWQLLVRSDSKNCNADVLEGSPTMCRHLQRLAYLDHQEGQPTPQYYT